MRRIIPLIFFMSSNLIAFGQIKYSANGISFSLPDGFKTTNPGAGEFAAFNRNNTLQIAFAEGCNGLSEQYKSNLDKKMTSDLCFETQFVKMKSKYGPASWTHNPQDTVIKKFNCKLAELHSTVKGVDYYLVYLLIKGKKYRYELLFSGHLENKSEDLKILSKVMSSYKER